MICAHQHNSPIKVIGVGGSGSCSISKVIEHPDEEVDYFSINNYVNKLWKDINFQEKVTLLEFTVNRQRYATFPYCYDNDSFYRFYLNDINIKLATSIIDLSTRHVILVTGMGLFLGTFGTSWLARLYKNMNVYVTVVCTIPFSFEGDRKRCRALDAVSSLQEAGITVKAISADDIIQKHEDFNLFDSFTYLDEHVADAVNEICTEFTQSRP